MFPFRTDFQGSFLSSDLKKHQHHSPQVFITDPSFLIHVDPISSLQKICYDQFSSVQFSVSVMSHSCWPHGLQHARLPCPSPSPGACSNSCPLSWWCHPTISSSVVPFSSCLQSFPAVWLISSESDLHIRWPRNRSFSFSISPSNEYSGLISFSIAWFDLLVVQGTPKSLLQHRRSKAWILQHSAFFYFLTSYFSVFFFFLRGIVF